jgi:hypothetical protein
MSDFINSGNVSRSPSQHSLANSEVSDDGWELIGDAPYQIPASSFLALGKLMQSQGSSLNEVGAEQLDLEDADEVYSDDQIGLDIYGEGSLESLHGDSLIAAANSMIAKEEAAEKAANTSAVTEVLVGIIDEALEGIEEVNQTLVLNVQVDGIQAPFLSLDQILRLGPTPFLDSSTVDVKGGQNEELAVVARASSGLNSLDSALDSLANADFDVSLLEQIAQIINDSYVSSLLPSDRVEELGSDDEELLGGSFSEASIGSKNPLLQRQNESPVNEDLFNDDLNPDLESEVIGDDSLNKEELRTVSSAHKPKRSVKSALDATLAHTKGTFKEDGTIHSGLKKAAKSVKEGAVATFKKGGTAETDFRSAAKKAKKALNFLKKIK